MKVARNLLDLVGETPLMRLERLFPRNQVYAKLEMFNPMSVKDRAVRSMIAAGLESGEIPPETEVVEASSGNTAIALAMLGVVMGFKVRAFMSELASVERRQIICAYGAKVVITPGAEHTKGARKRAMSYCEANPGTTFFLNQHGNPNNGRAHENTTGPEIWEQTNGALDICVIGLGTSGTFDGLSRYLKGVNSDIKIICFEPQSSPVYSGGAQGHHKLLGIGPGFITENFRRSQENKDELILVPDEAGFEMTRLIAQKEGLFVGPSSGAAAWVCSQIVKRRGYEKKTIACLFYDTGERYLSTQGLFTNEDPEFMA